ncbi:MAG: preprotein translocase subunit YajC [Thermoguttaceae bacterium]|nr:preprotein translocase subunit YajC [Thermoguttaceae bacterium]MBQ2037962.1 preprotein translocase subunit YajC [Thermoguttaceae bacterium]MBQ2555322.1 preprotein translocase subunit YajC [Thermoguttaceae bacterium]MBQ3822114.1 preprotein translocase subunit YajC [Thermoguttaceae bacterium]MBQ4080683.1 preprotein translocase subunit YajC [Thermoguttaceae bacterium]
MTVGLTLATSMLTPLFGQEAPSAPAGSGGFSLVMMIFVFLIAVFFLFILPGKSRDKQTKKLLDSIKPNDRVLTYGGVIGVVVNVDREQGEIVLRVDDNANVKMRFALSSVYYVYNKEAAKEAAKENAKKAAKEKSK